MRVLNVQEVQEVSGAGTSGYEGAGAIMTVVGFGALFTPIGAVTLAIGLGAAGGLAAAQFLSQLR